MEAFIFDFDGVIVDSERHWLHMDHSFFPQFVPGFTPRHGVAMMGLNLKAGYELLVRELQLSMTYEEYRKHADARIWEIYETLAQPLPGLETLLDALDSKNVPIGIASSSEREWIDTCLTRLQLLHRFRTISTPADVGGRAKPAPDVYLHAAAQLRAEPTLCVVLEDSKNGIASAKAAQMRCIAIRTDMNEQQDLSKADVVVKGLKEVMMSL